MSTTNKTQEDAGRVSVPVCFLVVGDRCWGKGATPNAAIKVAADASGSRNYLKEHIMFLVHPEATVSGIGSIMSPGVAPLELYRVIAGKQCPAGTKFPRGSAT